MKRINIKCPYCGSQALLRPASVVHKHTRSCLTSCPSFCCLRPASVVHKHTAPGEEVYVCARFPTCDAYVSAHRDSHLPMGTLADKSLRQKRRQAHIALNQLWEQGLMTRKEAYRWLQMQLGLPESEAHIGRFSAYRCEQVIDLCSRFAGMGQRAVETFDEQQGAQFHSYAISVIRNHLLDYCRKIQSRTVPVLPLEDAETTQSTAPAWDSDSSLFVEQVLEYGKRTYSGVARLGVEALELKIAGYSGTDIAKLYGVQPNHVGAWISRATQKLKKMCSLLKIAAQIRKRKYHNNLGGFLMNTHTYYTALGHFRRKTDGLGRLCTRGLVASGTGETDFEALYDLLAGCMWSPCPRACPCGWRRS